MDSGIVPLQKSVLGQQSGPFLRKIARDLARAFLMLILLMVLTPVVLNWGGENKHDVGGHFRHFDSFFMFDSFDDTICPSD